MFAYGDDITVTNRAQTGTDAYGNPTWTTSSIVCKGAFDPAIGYESVNGQDQMVTQPRALFIDQDAVDVAAVISSTSELTIRGRIYQVDGDAEDFRSPFTGWQAGLVVPLRRTTG